MKSMLSYKLTSRLIKPDFYKKKKEEEECILVWLRSINDQSNLFAWKR